MLTTQYNPAPHKKLNLSYGFSFNDFYDRDGLIRLDAAFLVYQKYRGRIDF